MAKFVIDMGVGVSIEHFLQAMGHHVFSVRQINPKMADQDILALALAVSAIVITIGRLRIRAI